MSSLVWKLNRLRAMGTHEILYRARNAVQSQLERCGFGLAQPRELRETYGRPWLAELPRGFDADVYRVAADRVLAGHFDIFALRDVDLGFPPRWNRDPKTGIEAPLSFGKALNFRDDRQVGDIKYVWEPNRHAELVTLAQAWHLTGEVRYASGCRLLLDSWFEQCPYPLGVNWTSSLEHGVRLVNWAVAWGLLNGGQPQPADCPVRGIFSGVEGEAFRRRWLNSVYQHCHFIAGHFSRHSSANNHLLGELMGLFVASVTWSCWSESTRWRDSSRAEFETESLKQTATDGVNREQAIWYHHEVADMMLMVGLFGRANGVELSPNFWERLEKMLEYVAAVMDVSGQVPMIGDADDARLVRFDPRQSADVFRSLLATGSVLFARGNFATKAGILDDKSRWLLGDEAANHFLIHLHAGGANRLVQAYPYGGYYILGADLDQPSEVRVVADAGPLGYLSIAAHGHADALAFTLSVAGREILIDPGTYTYIAKRLWRDYFKGTSAHNTVRVDGLDQSVSGGCFLWTWHADARCECMETNYRQDIWVASHNGYMRLQDPVLHRRSIVLDKVTRRLQVNDRLECTGQHKVEVFFHVEETCLVNIGVNGGVCIKSGPVTVRLRNLMPDWQAEVVYGRESPPMGWVSRCFDVRRPTNTIVWSGVINGVTELLTELEIAIDTS